MYEFDQASSFQCGKCSLSLYVQIREGILLIVKLEPRIGLHHYRHSKVKGLGTLNNFELVTFLAMLLYQSDDIEKNPGPNSASSTESDDSFQFPPLQGNLSMVHYNVQSLASKTDIIEPELTNFDIISLTETWLNDSISNEDLKFNEFQDPFRRDRIGDSHGGVIVYVKRGIPSKRRLDLELVNIECVWIEIIVKNKKVTNRDIL